MAEFIEKLSSKRWNERKEALDRIDTMLQSGSFSSLETSDLVNAVIKVLSTDTHSLLVTTSANMIARAASSMKNGFAPLAKSTLAACLSGFRSNKPAVISALRLTACATLNTLSIDSFMEAVLTSLADKSSNPSVKAEAASFLQRALKHYRATSHYPELPVRRALMKRLLAPLVPLMEDRVEPVRDAAYNALASARIFLADEKSYARLTAETIDSTKMARIDSVMEKLQSAAASESREPPVEATDSKKVKRIHDGPLLGPTKKRKTPASRLNTKPQTPATAVTCSDPFAPEFNLSEEDLKLQLGAFSISDVIFSHIKSSNWRDRLSSIENVSSCLEMTPLNSPSVAQSFISFLLQPPGLKDSNVRVKCRLLETMAIILRTSKQKCVSRTIFDTLMAGVGGMIGGIKELRACEACLTGLACATSAAVVGEAVLHLASTLKVSKAVEHLINWLANSVELSVFILNRSQTISHLQTGLGHVSGAARHAYIKLAGAVYAGLAFDSLFRGDLEGSCHSAIVPRLKAEFDERLKSRDNSINNAEAAFPSEPLISACRNAPPQSMHLESVGYPPRVSGASFVDDEDFMSPLGLSATFCAVSVPLLMADFKAKRDRIQQMSNSSALPTRDRLQTAFVTAGMHPNLRRLLTSWNTDTGKTLEALGLLTHLLQQKHPTSKDEEDAETAGSLLPHTDPLSDALANSDLLLLWMADVCFSAEPINEQTIAMSLDYLEAFVSRLADSKLTLTSEELSILLPWPILSPHLLSRYFCQSRERSNRLMTLLMALCRVLPADKIYCAVMEALSALVDPTTIIELLRLVKLLITRFVNIPPPSVADIKAIAQHIGSVDHDVHRAALECLKVARSVYTTEQISAMAGKLAERDRAFLEDALGQGLQASAYLTPMRPRTPCNVSYTNNPSILHSVSRSHLTQRSQLLGNDDDDEGNLLRKTRQWMLDVLAEDDRVKEASMVAFLISKLLVQPVDTDGSEMVTQALLAISHLEFLHLTTSTRDLLLPEASRLVRGLGSQMTCIGLGGVPVLDFSPDEAATIVSVTIRFVASIFRAAFLTRDLEPDSLSHLLAGLLRLQSTFESISKGKSLVGDISETVLSLILERGTANSINEDLLHILRFIHDRLVSNNRTIYIKALVNLMDSEWNGYIGSYRRSLLLDSYLHQHMLDLALKDLSSNCDPNAQSFVEVINALGRLYPFDPTNVSDSGSFSTASFGPGLQVVAFGWRNLRSIHSSRHEKLPNEF